MTSPTDTPPSRRVTAGLAGVSALATTFGTTLVAFAPPAAAVAPPSSPAPATATDVNNDWGQTAAQVTEEVNLVVDADPGVIAARTRYLHALSSYASLKHAQHVALLATRAAKSTPTKRDDIRALKTYQSVSVKVYAAAREVVASQLAMVTLVDSVTAAVRAQHYVQAPVVALPVAPTGLTAVPASGQVTLTWTAVPGATGYHVYRDGVLVALTSLPSFLDTGLDNGTAYAYRVLATNVAGWSPLTDAVHSTPTVLAPPVPTGVVANPGDGVVDLAWGSSASATSYEVYRDGVRVGTPTTPSFHDSGLIDGTTYLYTVVALNGSAASSPSVAVPGVPVAVAPAAPTNLVATPGNATVSLTWTASAGATKYDVIRDGVKLTTVTSPAYTDNAVTNGTTYVYTVVAYKQNSPASTPSASASAKPVAPPLSTPTNLAATPGDATVALTWSSVTNATSYQIWRNGAQYATSNGPSYTDNVVTNGTTYSYYVIAVGSQSSSAPSATVTAKPAAAATGAPTGLAAVAGNAQVSLSWNVVTGATGYKVYRGGVYLTTVTGNTYLNTGLSNGTAYTYYVTALNGATESAPSATVTATPFIPAPAAPTGLTATPGNKQVSLSWTASAGATSYNVYRGTTLIGSPTTTTWLDTSLTNGTAYSYHVVALNGSVASPDSTTVSATPLAPAPAAPTGLTATAGNAQVSLSWTAVTNATSYKVYRNGVVVGTPTAATYVDNGLTNGTTYTYYVTAVTDTTEGSPSTSVSGTPAKPPVNGTFTGATTAIANRHGSIQVVIVVVNSVITSATGTLVTSDGASETVKINQTSIPQYNTKAVAANSANITKVSGATLTWAAYKTSLQSALTGAGL